MKTTNPAKICAVVCEQRANNLPQAIARAAELADMVEVRLDCLADTEPAGLSGLCAGLLQGASRPLIVTLRSSEEGGQQTIDRGKRLDFWRATIGPLMSFPEIFVDIEAELTSDLASQEEFGVIDWRRVICSFHDFAKMPADVNRIYDGLAETPAGILKIAAQANDVIDCVSIFRLLERACKEGREMIAIAMGQSGIATRILGPSRGAFLTYGSVDDETATAPGQLTARELREVYRIDRIDRHTEIYGLMGRPVSHSVSPYLQNAAFQAAGVNAVYIPFETLDAGAFIQRMVHPRSREIDWNLRGLSVTAPHKSAVMEHLDWIEPAAREIGAVNTIVVRDGALNGYNTDAEAFIAPLQRALGSFTDVSCAVIGAGGTARTAVWSLQRAGARVTVVARNAEAAKPLANHFGIDCRSLQDASFKDFEIVVNATPLGTAGEPRNETPAVASQLRGVRLVYDLVYNPTETRLSREAKSAGCQCLGGLEMLLGQAAEQFRLWTGDDAPVSMMRAAANRALGNEIDNDQ